MYNYSTVDVRIANRVADITIHPQEETMTEPGIDLHWDLAELFARLRGDNEIRVIVLSGSGEDFFHNPPDSFHDESDEVAGDYVLSPPGAWRSFTLGTVRLHQLMAEIEKPIVAKVNGDASSFGQSLIFNSDIIVAAEDAVIVDLHMGLDDTPGTNFGLVPGDGGCSLLPLFMSPALAKEYLMLCRPFTASRLAELGLINYAVPKKELEDTVDEIIERLLERPAYALAWTKRVANRHVVNQLSNTLDAGAAYEMVNFLQLHYTDGQQSTEF